MFTTLINETAQVLAGIDGQDAVSAQATELAAIIQNDIFAYKNAHKDAIYVITHVSLYQMHSVICDFETIFDNHRDLFVPFLQQSHDDIMENFEGMTVAFIERVERNEALDVLEPFEFMVEVLKTYTIKELCTDILLALRKITDEQSIPF